MTDFEKRMREAAEEWADGNWVPPLGQTEFDVIENAFQSGARWAREETLEIALEYICEYRRAYDESIFPPVDMEQFDPNVRTVVAGRMGRFLLDNIANDLRALKGGKGEK